MKGRIHSIETFGTVDGPGIRYVVFLQGCNFRCAYCHNPDTWALDGGKEKEAINIISDAIRYKNYIGGITVTGGEPLLQIDFVIELFTLAKENGLNTCLDTSGSIFEKDNAQIVSKIDRLLEVCDLVMLDIKHIDSNKHQKLTGFGNENVLSFAKYLSEKGKDMWLRYVLLTGFNDSEEDLVNWKNFADTLNNVKNIELLPYHTLGVQKYKELGIPYRLEGVETPSKENKIKARQILGIGEK